MKDYQSTIQQCLKGNRLAQARLYEAFAPYSLAIIRRYGIEGGKERDLVQEIFIEIFTKLDRYDHQRGSFKTWLRKITIFRIIDFQRKNAKLPFTSIESTEGLDIPTNDEPLQHFPPSYLLSAIAQLPAGYRTVFNLYAVEGLSHEKIGQLLSISAAGSRSQYHRARKLLQKTLKKKLISNAAY